MNATVRPCQAKNPATCVYHGNLLKTFQPTPITEAKDLADYAAQRDAQKKEEAFHQMVHDIERSWKLKTYKDGTTTVTVYRSGVPTPPAERGVEKECFEVADANKPEGVQGRMDAVFAAPTLVGVSRWVRGNYGIVDDMKVRQMEVDIDKTYVYNVTEWEVSSGNYRYWGKQEEHWGNYTRTDYWKTGITMREYMKRLQEDPQAYDPTDWELLIPKDNPYSIKPVSGNRVADTVFDSSSRSTVRGILSGKSPHLWKQEHNEDKAA